MKLKFCKASTVQPKAIEWLWPGRIARGKIAVFCGDPGIGKGLVSCDLVAAVTTGRGFPDVTNTGEPADVLMLFCEDGQADTVRPRLEAAGADLDRVTFLNSELCLSEDPDDNLNADSEREEERFLALDKDVQLLRDYLAAHPDTKLIVIDPVTSYMGGASMNKEQEVRRMLGPVAKLAEETNVAVIPVMHNNKRGDVSALHRVMGAVANTGVARSVFVFAEDKDEAEGFLFVCAKINIGKMPKALKYRIPTKQLSVGEVPFIEWRGTSTITADQALGPKGDPSKLTEATKWLEGFLKSDTLAKDVLQAAKNEGISKKTLRRAKKDLRIVSDQTSAGYMWLPPDQDLDLLRPTSGVGDADALDSTIGANASPSPASEIQPFGEADETLPSDKVPAR